MSGSTDKPDIRPAIAGDVESFSDIDSLLSAIQSELPNSPFGEAGVLEVPDMLTADGTALHLMLNPDLMDGELEIYRVFPGLSVSIITFVAHDVDSIEKIAEKAVAEEKEIMVRLFQQGQIVYRFGDHIVDSKVSPGVLSYRPEKGRSGYELKAGVPMRITMFVISEEGEREVWHRLGITPSPLFQELRSAPNPNDRVFALPDSEPFKHFSASLSHLPKSGYSRTAFLKLKVGELFCLLGDIKPVESQYTNSDVPFSEVRKLSRARVILEERDGDSPSIADLSAMVGLNRRKLTEGFKAVYGDTVAGYALELRMRKGYQLLKESPLPVHEIAEECGYEHPSNFTIAFRRRFGCSPSEIRAQK